MLSCSPLAMKRLFLFLFFILCSGRLFAQAEVSALTGLDTMKRHVPDSLDSHVQVTKIVITGNRITREQIILREMSIRDGRIVARDSIAYIMNLNKIRIFNLALFNEVDIDVERIDSTSAIWHIDVKERWYIFPELSLKLADRNFNVWWYEQNHDIKRAIIGVALSHFNFRGNHEKLSVSAQVGYTQKFGINYERPFIDKKQRHGIGVSVYDMRNRETYFRTDSNKLEFARSQTYDVLRAFETNLTYTYRPAYATRHLFQVSYRNYRIADTIRDLNPNYFANGGTRADYVELFLRVDINKVDNWNYPLRGFKFIGSVTNRVGFSGLGWQSFANLETAYFQNPFGKWFWNVIFRGRLMLPERPPYAFLGGMGGQVDYMRGYEYYVIDGPQYGLFRFDFKNELVNYSIKGIPIRVLSVIPIRLYPKIFADIGTVRNPNPLNSRLNNRFLYSYGVGVDLVTLYDLKLRFEYAFNHLSENDLFLHSKSE
jgi:outer membrane protein assembly factor BamA